jgi:hypothetical protein
MAARYVIEQRYRSVIARLKKGDPAIANHPMLEILTSLARRQRANISPEVQHDAGIGTRHQSDTSGQ